MLEFHFIRWQSWWLIKKSCLEYGALDRVLGRFSSVMIYLSVRWTCSALWILFGSAGHFMLRSIWQHTWRPYTERFIAASATNPLYMTSTSCPSPSMTGKWARLPSTYLPRWWTLYTWTGARILLKSFWMAKIRRQGNTRAWSSGYSA